MSIWKQLVLGCLVVAAAVAGWAAYVPAARPWLDWAGLLQPLQDLGLVAPVQEAAAVQRQASPSGGPVVVAKAPAMRALVDSVTALGSARGARSVVIEAEVLGQILSLDVQPGQYVEAGSVIAQLDIEAAQIALDRATLILADARTTTERVLALQARGSATDLQVQEADLALKTAELQHREALFELDRHRIEAPISGWVGILAVEAGDRIAPGVEITRIEDRSSLIVDFRVPERVVSRLAPGDALTVTPLADPGALLPGRIVALDNRVDETSRSLLVQASIDNAEDALRAGMAFSVVLDFTGGDYPAVDPLAIQWDATGAFVWIVRDGKAQRLAVRIIQRNSDAVLVEADLAEGDLVVTEGVQALRPGTDVRVAPGDGASASASGQPAPRG
ncbi:MAG: efflux RND transporter periplasmic adaptor subunit [Gemmobacter sp.]